MDRISQRLTHKNYIMTTEQKKLEAQAVIDIGTASLHKICNNTEKKVDSKYFKSIVSMLNDMISAKKFLNLDSTDTELLKKEMEAIVIKFDALTP